MRWLVIAAVLSAACQSKRDEPVPDDPLAKTESTAPALEGCDALLTSADVEELCGAQTPVVADSLENKGGIRCSRRGGPVDRWLALTVGRVADVEAAEKITGGVAEGEVSVDRRPSGANQRLVAVGRRGTTTMTLATLVPAGKPGLCSDEQLTALARRVYSRLGALD
jgi:hypothetical protein